MESLFKSITTPLMFYDINDNYVTRDFYQRGMNRNRHNVQSYDFSKIQQSKLYQDRILWDEFKEAWQQIAIFGSPPGWVVTWSTTLQGECIPVEDLPSLTKGGPSFWYFSWVKK